jgi:uncharacterized protein with NRDE domain
MCLIAFSIGAHPRWPLLIASNRDEYFDRPTLPLQRWTSPGGQAVISGRDGRSGGIWLGLGEGGRVAWLTNVREARQQVGPRSRGELPLAWIDGTDTAQAFIAGLDPLAYPGFNLVVGDLVRQQWHWISNRRPGPDHLRVEWQHQSLAPGVYGLSNAFLDTPWPKTVQLRQHLARALEEDAPAEPLRERLWSALSDHQPAPDQALPRTGVPIETERALSSALVKFPDGRYGTRSSTVLMVDAPSGGHWQAQMHERSWDPHSLGQSRREQLVVAGRAG